ncbi:hypothetical protein NPIL_574061 [Nephila pilipes]|uniref:Uncharacterized protein n=1 Tax=Nephila pilipes TaxID=299642 RepID=A0A8X6QP41_NEPPI|nr:hypothetical protein NPIL_574061 [Nephila pilipes]
MGKEFSHANSLAYCCHLRNRKSDLTFALQLSTLPLCLIQIKTFLKVNENVGFNYQLLRFPGLACCCQEDGLGLKCFFFNKKEEAKRCPLLRLNCRVRSSVEKCSIPDSKEPVFYNEVHGVLLLK